MDADLFDGGDLGGCLPHLSWGVGPPSAGEMLTEYYWWLAVGGFFGGAFNALLVPAVFDRLIEYPLALVAACLLLPRWSQRPALVGSGH